MQERRLAVHAKLTGTGGQTRAYYAGLAAALGYTSTIQEYRPFRAGSSAPGDAVTNEDWIYRWLVRVAKEANLRPFRAGQSVAGEPVATWGDERLECAINQTRPHRSGIRLRSLVMLRTHASPDLLKANPPHRGPARRAALRRPPPAPACSPISSRQPGRATPQAN